MHPQYNSPRLLLISSPSNPIYKILPKTNFNKSLFSSENFTDKIVKHSLP